MNRMTLAAIAALIGVLAVQPAAAQHGGAHQGGHHHTGQDAGGFMADMEVVHELLTAHEAIDRTVTLLPDGVRTLTESDDPLVASYIREHVLSMNERLSNGEIFNMNSPTIPIIFENADRIRTEIEETPNGVAFTQTTDDPELVPVLQAHADEVSEFVLDGMEAMMRSMRERGGAMQHMGPGMHGR